MIEITEEELSKYEFIVTEAVPGDGDISTLARLEPVATELHATSPDAVGEESPSENLIDAELIFCAM